MISITARQCAEAAVAAVLLSVGSQTVAAEISHKGETVEIRGAIASGDLLRYSTVRDEIVAAGSNVRAVRISSMGGSVMEASGIAELIALDKPAIIIDGPCVSACASLMFLSSSPRRFERGGFVAFHGSQKGMYRQMARAIAPVSGLPPSFWRDEFLKDMRIQAILQIADKVDDVLGKIHESAGVAPDLDIRVTELTSARWCIKTNALKKSIAFDPDGQAPFDFWVPDAKSLSQVGISSTGLSISSRWLTALRLGISADRIHWGELPAREASSVEACVREETEQVPEGAAPAASAPVSNVDIGPSLTKEDR
jgi:hypothetical protein